MNWDRIAGRLRQWKGTARQQWGRLIDDYVGVVAGRREHVIGEIQAAYGIVRQVQEKRLAEWRRAQRAG